MIDDFCQNALLAQGTIQNGLIFNLKGHAPHDHYFLTSNGTLLQDGGGEEYISQYIIFNKRINIYIFFFLLFFNTEYIILLHKYILAKFV